MVEIAQEFSELVLLKDEKKFHDIFMEMLQSLDTAQKIVKKAYYLFERRDDAKEAMPSMSEPDAEKLASVKARLREYTTFMEGLSEELNTKFSEGKFPEFQEAVEDMIDSLDKTRDVMKKVYFQANFEENKPKRESKGNGGGP